MEVLVAMASKIITNDIPYPKRWWVDKFWTENFAYDEVTGCLNWIGKVNSAGYGRTSMNGVLYLAHRMAYAIYYLDFTNDLLVRHTCDNRRCCHPLHLVSGTHKENTHDAMRRGRFQTGDRHFSHRRPELIPRGENAYAAKLTELEVREIKILIGLGFNNGEIAESYDCVKSNISAIRRGISWKHIE